MIAARHKVVYGGSLGTAYTETKSFGVYAAHLGSTRLRLLTGPLAPLGKTDCLTPLPLDEIIYILNVTCIGWRRQEYAAIGLVLSLDIEICSCASLRELGVDNLKRTEHP